MKTVAVTAHGTGEYVHNRNPCYNVRRGRRRRGEGEPAAGEETLDGYVKKDLFHCQNQKALPKSQL